MSTHSLHDVIHHLRRAVLPIRDEMTDGELLAAFLQQRDDDALAALVRRHGPLVWGVCHRILRQDHEAEDAFQATFLLLVRRAATIREKEKVAHWLYRVAHQTALRARAIAARRSVRERQVVEMPESAAAEHAPWDDLQPLLDQELSRLPDRYGVVIVLCDLQGNTRREAARQLGCAEGTIASRLARARGMLAKRLARHGLAVSVGSLAAMLSQHTASACVPTAVVSSTIKAANLLAAGQAAAPEIVSANVAALTEGVQKAMLVARLKSGISLVLATALVVGSVLIAGSLLTGGTAYVPVEELRGVNLSMSMFGGTPQRNMVNLVDKDIPSDWDVQTGKNIKWSVKLGSRAYGGPVAAGGKIYCGTNNEAPRNPAIVGDKGVLMCFRESDGEFLGQAVHAKLHGAVNDWPHQGVCSTPTIVGNRLYYVSNRCEVICASTEPRTNDNEKEIRVLWRYDMIEDLNVYPHNMSACCPLVHGDMVYVVTSNGVDGDHVGIPSPDAPSFIALDMNGKLVWRDNSPGKNIMHGQWSNPTLYEVDGKAQIIFPGGDGWLRGFDPKTGAVLWRFDANPKDAKGGLGGKGTRNDFMATPVVYDNKIYIGTGHEPEQFGGVGHFWCIDPAGKKHDISSDLVVDNTVFPPKTRPNPNSAVVWHYGGPTKKEDAGIVNRDYYFGRTMSTAAIHDGLVYIAELDGYLHCLDARTGQKYWEHDLKAPVWGSAYWVDGKIYLASEDGEVFVFEHGKTKKPPKRIDMGDPVRSTPMVANGALYIMTEKNLYAIASELR